MATSSSETRKSNLRPIQRLITTHDESGQAVFSNIIPEAAPIRPSMGGVMEFMLLYTTGNFPVDLNDDNDVQKYKSYISHAPALAISGGSVLRIVDFAPGYTSPMHRTISCDFGVVLEGEVELILDSGETRLLKRGDVAVQRGTNHAWRNTSENEWVRMMYVLQAATPVKVRDMALEEDEAGID
jgi:quercetin dioxygenase-like cupin family protein